MRTARLTRLERSLPKNQKTVGVWWADGSGGHDPTKVYVDGLTLTPDEFRQRFGRNAILIRIERKDYSQNPQNCL